MRNMTASILARLKNRAKADRIQLQQLLNLFCQEEFMRRLSQSEYRESLILKGGFLLYSISGFTTRPTVDSDYLLKNHASDLDSMRTLVSSVIESEAASPLITIEIRNMEMIAETGKYPGVRVNLVGLIGGTRTPFSVDFGVGDIVIPAPIERTLPVLLPEFEQPTVLTYSLESVVAEKLDAVISLMELTSRMKDFYDIYYLASTFNFEGRKLQEAFFETLSNRGTSYELDSVDEIARLAQESNIQKRWDAFCRRVLQYSLSLDTTIRMIVNFAGPPFRVIVEEDEFFKVWDSGKSRWV